MIELALLTAIGAGTGWLMNGAKGVVAPPLTTPEGIRPEVMTQAAELVPVTLPNGERWLVARDYVGPIGINEARILASALGMQLPTPQLVDAIWRQADLKLLPSPRDNVISQKVFDDQRRTIQGQIGGRGFTLLGGSFKDVVDVGGHAQIYGWHVEDGKTVAGVPLLAPITPGPGRIIQPLSGSRHDSPGPVGFKDYSQGLRLVRRA